MALMDESVWRGKIYSGGWVRGELGSGLDVARAAQIAPHSF
jgi:hypothetical protein